MRVMLIKKAPNKFKFLYILERFLKNLIHRKMLMIRDGDRSNKDVLFINSCYNYSLLIKTVNKIAIKKLKTFLYSKYS